MRILVACTVIAFGTIACHRTTTYVSGGGLASVRDGLPDSAPCNDIEQQGAEVDLVASPASPAKGIGGPIEDGTYVLTQSNLHTKDTTAGSKLVTFGKITMVVRGPISQLVKTSADGRVKRSTVKRENVGIVTIARTTCTSPTPTDGSEIASTEYTATSGSLQFITPGPAGTVVGTYTKR